MDPVKERRDEDEEGDEEDASFDRGALAQTKELLSRLWPYGVPSPLSMHPSADGSGSVVLEYEVGVQLTIPPPPNPPLLVDVVARKGAQESNGFMPWSMTTLHWLAQRLSRHSDGESPPPLVPFVFDE